MENLVVWTLYLFSFYAFLPAFISRTFGFRVFKKGLVKKEIALTFDDGPDAIYTPKLLELLARYDAKATFSSLVHMAKRSRSYCAKYMRKAIRLAYTIMFTRPIGSCGQGPSSVRSSVHAK